MALRSQGKPNLRSGEWERTVLREAAHSGSGARGGTGDRLSHRKNGKYRSMAARCKKQEIERQVGNTQSVAYRNRRPNSS